MIVYPKGGGGAVGPMAPPQYVPATYFDKMHERDR